MEESTIRGVSVRAWLALMSVGTGLLFLYALGLAALWVLPLETAVQIVLTVVVAVIGFINLSLGYYLGQKTAASVTDVSPDR